MNNTSTITTKGQVTIPIEVRNHFHLKPGDQIEFIIKNKSITLNPKPNDPTAIFGIIQSKHTASLSDIEDAIEKEAGK